MKKNKLFLCLNALMTIALVGCGSTESPTSTQTSAEPSVTPSTEVSNVNSEATPSVEESSPSVDESVQPSEEVSTQPSEVPSIEESVQDSVEESSEPTEPENAFVIETTVENGYTTDAQGNYFINVDGVYTLSGHLDGSILLDANLASKVTLNLNNFTCTSISTPCIYWQAQSSKVLINLVENSVNELTVAEDVNSVYENSAIASENNVEITGLGTLKLTSAQKHGIKGKEITISGGNLNVENCIGDGIHGKAVIVSSGNVTVKNCSDAIEAEKNSSGKKGTIEITGGTLVFAACKSGLSAEASISVTGTEEAPIDITCTDCEFNTIGTVTLTNATINGKGIE